MDSELEVYLKSVRTCFLLGALKVMVSLWSSSYDACLNSLETRVQFPIDALAFQLTVNLSWSKYSTSSSDFSF